MLEYRRLGECRPAGRRNRGIASLYHLLNRQLQSRKVIGLNYGDRLNFQIETRLGSGDRRHID